MQHSWNEYLLVMSMISLISFRSQIRTAMKKKAHEQAAAQKQEAQKRTQENRPEENRIATPVEEPPMKKQKQSGKIQFLLFPAKQRILLSKYFC